MQPDIRLAQLLQEMKRRTGTVARLAQAVGVDDRILRTWFARPDEQLRRLHSSSVEQILSGARSLGIEPELYSSGPALWDPAKSYEENLLLDPGVPPVPGRPLRNHRISFLGREIASPFGASASVLTSTSRRIQFFARGAVDVIIYKTVRSTKLKPHPYPNLFDCGEGTPELDPGQRRRLEVLVGNGENFRAEYGKINRFGTPSPHPEVWQADFAAAKAELDPGQLLILSVVGTAERGSPDASLIADFVKVAEYGVDAGAEVLELNFSCPNRSGPEAGLFRNKQLASQICRQLSHLRVKLLIKIGFLRGRELREFFLETASYVDGYSAINSIPVVALREGQIDPEPAWGKVGLEAGLSGRPILRCGLRCTQELSRIREEERATKIAILGGGGVTEPADVMTYLKSGADIVQCTTAFFIDPFFGMRVRNVLDSELSTRRTVAEDEADIARFNWSRACGELEKELGARPETLRAVRDAALLDFVDWENRLAQAQSLGPRRRWPVPSITEFKNRIRGRLSKV
jgi:dihydroorotate dehydrogenase